MELIIGKQGNQPFSIVDEYVSRKHAIFTYNEATKEMTLTDTSKNGTFVKMGGHFQQISTCRVTPNTEVRLGMNFVFRIGQLFNQKANQQVQNSTKPIPQNPQSAQQPQKPKKADIAFLRKVAEQYESNKMQIEKKQNTLNGLRSLTIVGTVLGSVLSGALGMYLGEDAKQYVWIAPVFTLVFLGSLVTYIISAGGKVLEMKNRNEKDYKIRYCCPTCHLPLAGKLYENILAEGKCGKCKTEYYDSNI